MDLTHFEWFAFLGNNFLWVLAAWWGLWILGSTAVAAVKKDRSTFHVLVVPLAITLAWIVLSMPDDSSNHISIEESNDLGVGLLAYNMALGTSGTIVLVAVVGIGVLFRRLTRKSTEAYSD